MIVTGTHFNYYQVCKRKLWLFANGINMEDTSDLVYDGKLIHETSYPQRSERYEEVEIDGIKIDYYDARNKVIHEIKRSDKVEPAHEWQVKYYIYVLERNGVKGVSGLLEYPTLRQTTKVELTDADRQKIAEMEKEITEIIHSDDCPPVIHSKICKTCSYYDFCYVEEGKDS
ncbi:MAG: CRISPR-associated protein Cas4 [Lentimicrobium sp.]